MFRWLFGRRKKVSQSTIPPMKLRDSWEACGGGFYVTQFRTQLDEVAKSLVRNDRSRVRTRFNGEKRCAELYDQDGVVAYVQVHGECGLPEKAIITSDLSPEGKALFVKLFAGLRVEFKALTSLV